MDEMFVSNYRDLFFDSFLSSLIVPMKGEMLFAAMKAFGDYSPVHLFICALVASTLGTFINFSFGKLLVRMFEVEPGFSEALRQRYELFQRSFKKYVLWLLLFSWVFMLGPVLSFLAGLLRMRTSVVMGLAIVGRAIHYAYVLMN